MATITHQSVTRERLNRLSRTAILNLTVTVFLVSILLPLYYIFLTAFAPSGKLFSKPLNYFPDELGFGRFGDVFGALPIGRYLFNTLVLSTSSTLVSLLICFLAAYSIARLRFSGANLVLMGLLISSMLPGAASVIPLFEMFQDFHLMNTFQGLLLLYASALLPFTTWVLVSFIKQIPPEIEEAARVDGASYLGVMWQIVLPMIVPGLATLFLINFIVNWNEFFTPLIFARGENSKVIAMAISEAQGIGSATQYYQNWGNMSAVAILATIPVFVITLLFQRQITEGIMSGAVK